MKNIAYKISVIIFIGSLLAGCGGNSETSTSSISSDTKPTAVSGAVVAAPIDNATVEARVNNDWIKVGTTRNGQIIFNNLEKITKYPALLRANADGRGRNSKIDAPFFAELRGVMVSRTDTVYLTPVTTLGAYLFDHAGGTIDAAQKARVKITSLIQKTLGFSSVDPYANPLGDGLITHEVVQQTFMVLLNLGEETNNASMQQFTTVMEKLATGMEKNTFLGAVTAINPNVTAGIEHYLDSQKSRIAQRAAALLYDHESTAAEQEAERINLLSSMNTILESMQPDTTVAEKFICERITEGSTATVLLSSPVYAPKKKNVPALRFKLSLLSNNETRDTILRPASSSAFHPTSNKFTITALPSVGILNEGVPVSVIPEQKLKAGSTTYSSGSEFSFFFDVESAPLEEQHSITFTATDNPDLSYTITLIIKGEDEIVIESVSSAGSSKLYPFDEGEAYNIPIGSITTLTEGQLAAKLTPAFDVSSPEKIFEAVQVRFTAPDNFMFRGQGAPRQQVAISIPPIAANNSFTFSMPANLDIIATGPSPVGKKVILIDVIEKNTQKILAQASGTVYFVPKSHLADIASATITNQSQSEFTYPKESAESDITLDNLTFSCQLQTWYDLAEIPKEQQPETVLELFPNVWTLRFDNAPTDTNGFKARDESYTNELDLQPFILSGLQNPIQFGLVDYSKEGGDDCRPIVKPFTASDSIHLYFKMNADSEHEYAVKGNFILKQDK